MINVLVVDDHKVVRESLCQILNKNDEFNVINDAGTIAAAKSLINSNTQFDVLVLDIDLPDGDGIEFAHQVRERYNECGIVFLSMHSEAYEINRAIQVSGAAYVTKNDSIAELSIAISTAIDTTAQGYLSSTAQRANNERQCQPAKQLSNREKEVLKLLASGLNQQQVADQLNISTRTVEAHVSRIRNKTDLGNLADLTRFALKLGLIAPH